MNLLKISKYNLRNLTIFKKITMARMRSQNDWISKKPYKQLKFLLNSLDRLHELYLLSDSLDILLFFTYN